MSKFKVGDTVRVREGEGEGVDLPDFSRHIVREADGDGLVRLRGVRRWWYQNRFELVTDTSDEVNHPDHYKWLPVEAIEITEHFNFCMGNALKYILRADHKGSPVKDLEKAIWYLRREIANRESRS